MNTHLTLEEAEHSSIGPVALIEWFHTGISSHLGAKLRDWADRQAEAGCNSWAVLSSNDSKTRYLRVLPKDQGAQLETFHVQLLEQGEMCMPANNSAGGRRGAQIGLFSSQAREGGLDGCGRCKY